MSDLGPKQPDTMAATGQYRTFEEIAQMLTWTGKQGVTSSDGFEVQSIDRFSIAYREGPQVVTVNVEHGNYGGGPSVSIERDAFARWDNLRLTNPPEKQAQMRTNFVAAMKFQGIAVEP